MQRKYITGSTADAAHIEVYFDLGTVLPPDATLRSHLPLCTFSRKEQYGFLMVRIDPLPGALKPDDDVLRLAFGVFLQETTANEMIELGGPFHGMFIRVNAISGKKY